MDNCKGEPSTSLMGYGRKIFERDDYTCVYCGRKFKDDFWSWMLLTVEHVIPQSQIKKEENESAKNELEEFIKSEKNFRTACRVCNNVCNKIDLNRFSNLPLEEKFNKIFDFKKENIKKRLEVFEKFYNECINP